MFRTFNGLGRAIIAATFDPHGKVAGMKAFFGPANMGAA